MRDLFKDKLYPHVIQYADAESKEGRYKTIRIMLSKSADDSYALHRLEYGVGFRSVVDEEVLQSGFQHRHLAEDAFESELVFLEQSGFDVYDVIKRQRPNLRLSELALSPLKSIAYSAMSDDQKNALSGRNCMRLYSGLQVVVIADAFMQINVYPANRVGVKGCELSVRAETELYLQRACFSGEPEPSIIEGFYSDTSGFAITDGVLVRGKEIHMCPFKERHALLVTAYGEQRGLFYDGVAPLHEGSNSLIGQSSTEVVDSPVYLLKADDAPPQISYASSLSGWSLLIDDSPACLASVKTEQNGINLYNMKTGVSFKLKKPFSFSYYECLNAVAFSRSNTREPLLFF